MNKDSEGHGEPERSQKWLPAQVRTESLTPSWAWSKKTGLGVCALRLERVSGGVQLQPPNPAPHPRCPLSSHLQSVVSTPWGFWLLCKGVLAGCRDKKAKG